MKFDKKEQIQKAETLKVLHYVDTPLILPNIWDPIGALMLQKEGFSAVATSSSAVAQSQGFKDGENIPFHLFLTRHLHITSAVSLPVTADIESGFASNKEQLEENIKALIKAGVVGINFEDSDKETGELVPIDTQCHKLEIIRNIADKKGIPLFINARIDTYVKGDHLNQEGKLKETLKRARAYKEAGADCVFPILIKEEKEIKTLIENTDLPVNVMTFPGIPNFKDLAEMGVKRISLGGSLLKIATQSILKIVNDVKDLNGPDSIFKNSVDSEYLNKLIDQ